MGEQIPTQRKLSNDCHAVCMFCLVIFWAFFERNNPPTKKMTNSETTYPTQKSTLIKLDIFSRNGNSADGSATQTKVSTLVSNT